MQPTGKQMSRVPSVILWQSLCISKFGINYLENFDNLSETALSPSRTATVRRQVASRENKNWATILQLKIISPDNFYNQLLDKFSAIAR